MGVDVADVLQVMGDSQTQVFEFSGEGDVLLVVLTKYNVSCGGIHFCGGHGVCRD
jgi:hypothetical protein